MVLQSPETTSSSKRPTDTDKHSHLKLTEPDHIKNDDYFKHQSDLQTWTSTHFKT